MEFEIKNIFGQFDVKGSLAEFEPIKSGHINDTFLIKTDVGERYVLQRINHLVFKNPAEVVANKIAVSQHLVNKASSRQDVESEEFVLTFLKTHSGDHLLKDDAGNYWNLMKYIEDSLVYLRTPNREIAFEAGKAFGRFIADTEDLDPSSLNETLPRFHSMSLRYEQFEAALKSADQLRLEAAGEYIEIAHRVRSQMHQLEKWIGDGLIPFRVTHNDTKISNALFSTEGKALCVIDLDTAMRGVVHYDFGDAVRTICSGADEDEQDETRIDFNSSYFEAFVEGFIGKSGINLTKAEVSGLALSAKIMTFIVGLRFLTDYLNNDIYFDTKYETHNLIRARNQFRLAGLFGEHMNSMNEIVMREYERTNNFELKTEN